MESFVTLSSVAAWVCKAMVVSEIVEVKHAA